MPDAALPRISLWRMRWVSITLNRYEGTGLPAALCQKVLTWAGCRIYPGSDPDRIRPRDIQPQPMASVSEHYARHLGPIYEWMLGDADEVVAKTQREVAALDLPYTTGTAADLGAGLGFHTVVLAGAGYTVTAIDSDSGLLTALRDRARHLPVRAVEADLLAFRQHAPGPLDAVLCMGDTLTHLPDRVAVETLARRVADALGPGGVFCATFRDYTRVLEGDARFIPVRRDENRTHTAFLEYSSDVVTVHDLLHERGEDGWALRVSSYPKLRLDPAWVAALFEEQGLGVERGSGLGGMVRLTVRAM